MTIVKRLKSRKFAMSYGLMKLSPATRSAIVGMISPNIENLEKRNTMKIPTTG